MNDDRFDDFLQEAARSYHEPPPVPRAELWARIQTERQTIRRLRPPRRAWPLGIAALLALAFGIGRLTAPKDRQMASTPAPVTAVPEWANEALAVAATQHLSRTEAFLTDFRAQSHSDARTAAFSTSARELLSSTRLLLDAPGLRDPRTRALLQDLELVLAQITQLEVEARGGDLDLIRDGLNQRGLMARLRTAIPAGPTARAQGES
jgi:hypothetical protein